ncbi:MAG: hypothetical protein RI897_141 [Verrucomicrobiota bacterium]
MGSELLGGGCVGGLSVDHFGEAGVGFDPDGEVGGGFEALGEGDEVGDTLAAVGADGIGAGLGEDGGDLFRGIAHHGAVFVFAGIEDHAGDDGQAGGFGGGDGYAGFLGVGHGFDDEGIDAAFGEGLGLFCEGFEEGIGGDVAGQQHFTGGADTAEDAGVVLGGGAGDLGSEPVDFGGFVFESGFGEAGLGGAEGIGEDNFATGVDVEFSDFEDAVGVGEVPGVGEFAQLESAGLQLGAPGAVGDDGRAGGYELIPPAHDLVLGFTQLPW